MRTLLTALALVGATLVAIPAVAAPAATSAATIFGLRLRADLPVYDVKVETIRQSWFNSHGRLRESVWTNVTTTLLGWRADMDFAGDGAPEHLGKGRFLYVVPEGRMLVLNKVALPWAVKLNGFPLGASNDPQPTADVRYVFGPGASVLIEIEPQEDGPGSPRKQPAISGYTTDPALEGGSVSGDGGAAK